MFLHLVTSATYCGNLVLSGLGPGSALGEKEKKIGVGEKKKNTKKKRRAKRTEKYSREGKGWHRLGNRSPIFFLSRPRFLAFSPTAETGPRLSIKTVITG